jgi:hypothetical protein
LNRPHIEWSALRVLWRPVAILLGARIVAFVALELTKSTTHFSPFYLQDWDANWYVAAAAHGWPSVVSATQNQLGFFPGLPLVIRAVHSITRLDWWIAAYVAQIAIEVVMAAVFWLLARDVWDERVADRATALLCFFPAAYIFSFVYAEPLFLAAACACILALRRRWWLLAGVAAAVGTGSRPEGIALVVCCGWEAYVAVRDRQDWRALSAIALAPAGLVAWLVFLWSWTGSPLAWSHAQTLAWGQHVDPLSLVRESWHVVRGVAPLEQIVSLLSAAVAVVLLAIMLKKRSEVPAVLLVFTGVVLVLSSVSSVSPLHPRILLTAFPLIMILARVLRGRAYQLVIGACAALMVTLQVVTLSTRLITP